MQFHLLANSHLDPVWLWDWREGLNEGITTCRAVLKLMEEFSELTYLRGETSIYKHVERHDPKTFEAIRTMVDAKRWDVVGGTVCQPDTNLPATEVLCRHFTDGLRYMRQTLNVRPTVAWAADSFGHSLGWPEIYSAAGMHSFAFTRPFARDRPLSGPAFWWKSKSGARILCWRVPTGWYGSDRGEVAERLDKFRELSDTFDLENIAVFFGLGDHGGGPTRRQIQEILRWRGMNGDIDVRFSTLHTFFDCLRTEAAGLPVVSEELNFTMRGCYSSAARFKFAYRKTENLLLEAERSSCVISAALGFRHPDLGRAWDALLFNTFHDILPGTAIERAFDDQTALLGVAYHEAQQAQLTALNRLAARVDTAVGTPGEDMPTAVPFLLWNPHPWEFSGNVEFEAALDYRPIASYRGRPNDLPVTARDERGRPMTFQLAAVENHFSPEVPWRKRFVMPVVLPAFGWKVVSVAWDEESPGGAIPRDCAPRAHGVGGTIRNDALSVSAAVGATGIAIKIDGKPLFGREGFEVCSFDDPFGSWGGHDGEVEADDISTELETWTVREIHVLEAGPHRAALWVRLGGGASRIDLTFYLDAGARATRIAARLLWNERGARLKLVMPGGEIAQFEVPGTTIDRGPMGEVPGGRWVRIKPGRPDAWLFASDALYNFDAKDGALRATIVRSTRYAWSSLSRPESEPWQPHLDLGEHRFQFLLGAGDIDPWKASSVLEQPPQAMATFPHDGALKGAGSFLRLPAGVRLLAVKPAESESEWIVRLQIVDGRSRRVLLHWLGSSVDLGPQKLGAITTWKLSMRGARWVAAPTNVAEDNSVSPGEEAERIGGNGSLADAHKPGVRITAGNGTRGGVARHVRRQRGE